MFLIILIYAAIESIHIKTSSHSIARFHYLCIKTNGEAQQIDLIYHLFRFCKNYFRKYRNCKKALRIKHRDFEDAIQIFCAHKIENLTAIITRNLKDFSTAEVKIFAPDEALQYINDNLKK